MSKATTARTEMKSVAFSICGEWLTDHLRHRVLSNDWRGALNLMIEDIGGCTHEIAYAILKGEKKFVGNSSSEAGVTLADDDINSDAVAGYLETLAFQYSGLLKHEGRVYRPSWRIEALGVEDHKFASEECSASDSREFLYWRARYYAGTSGIPYHITLPNSLEATTQRVDMRDEENPAEWIVLWAPCDDYPVWMSPHQDQSKALADYVEHRRIQVNGADTEILDMIRDNPEGYKSFLRKDRDLCWDDYAARDELLAKEYEEGVAELRSKIVAQAGPIDGDGWMRLPVFKEASSRHYDATPDSYVQVPKAPFLLWSLGDVRAEAFGVAPEWTRVSPPGMKMMNDNAYHNDWVIGAGFNPENFYAAQKDVSDSSYVLRQKLARELMNFEFAVLSKSSKASVHGKVKRLEPGETLNKGQIGVIAHAGVQFDAALRSAAKHGCAIICITGGPLAHMATVGRELDVPIIMWDKAVELRDYMDVWIDMNKGTISVSV
jgi:phosphohistidine swiveling domain-containing protein